MLPEDQRERLIRLARAAAELSEPNRRYAIADLIHERFRPTDVDAALRGEPPDIVCTVDEIILCAYPTTAHYWHAWLYGRLDRYELIRRLAEATAVSEIDLQLRRRRLDVALATCPFDIDGCAAEVAALWLAEHPDTEGLLHPSLLDFLRRGCKADVRSGAERCSGDGQDSPRRRGPPAGKANHQPRLPHTKSAAQAMYDEMIANAKQLPDDDALHAWAKANQIAIRRLPELRRNCTDKRLHKRGRRPTNPRN